MRPRIRSTKATKRRVLSERSRHTVRHTVAALRRSRDALVDLEGQLGELLVRLRTPGASLDTNAGDRLAGAKKEAIAAMTNLVQTGHLLA